MRVGFFPLLLGTLILGVGAGGAAAYATSANRNAAPTTAPVVASDAVAPAAPESGAAAQRRPGAFPAGQAPAASGGQAAGSAPSGQPTGGDPAQAGTRAVTGAVTRIEGNQIILVTPQGPMTVTVGDATTVQRSVPASFADVKAGDRLLVTTRQAPDGSLTAVGIQIVAGN